MSTQTPVVLAWNLLRYSYGAVLLLAGLDKVFATNLIVDWAQYISSQAMSMLPSVSAFLFFIGVVEVVVAVLMLTKFQRLAGYLSVAWLLIISLNLVILGTLDIAIRDVLLAVGALVLVLLTDTARETSRPAHAA